ncbi:MAG TPA: M81 family metallopeptidase [Feifaniaceae bacterium]|nr:M81 family metallopeptidase [Feifaniaceae bacterium]
MKIAVGSLQQESNSLSPILSCEKDFDIAYGREMFAKINVMDLLTGIDAIPTLYAHALPGGPVQKEEFLRLAHGIVDVLPGDLDGIWLYLHGAMEVEGLGSGETCLLRMIREKVGHSIPISVAMDFHANNTDEIVTLANVICGFRTAPHVDKAETERKAMRLLLYCIRNKLLPRPQLARANVILPGDSVQTARPPLDAIMAEADGMEKLPGMLCAQVFNGQPWVDSLHTGPNMVVTHESDEALAKACAERLARMFYEARYNFRFLVEAVEPHEAIRRALNAKERPVFITDSGDNTTAGAAGDNAYFLRLLQRSGARGVLLAGLMDKAACAACYAADIGDALTLKVGASLDPRSESTVITGRLVHRGDVLGYTGGNAGHSATLDCGEITVVLTQQRAAFTNLEIFRSIDLDIFQYDIVVVKLGYLFPELAEAAPRALLALTPGGSTERLEDMGHTRIRRPMFPLDDHFMD